LSRIAVARSVTTDVFNALIDGDQFVLFVLLSLTIGNGVGLGRGWIQPVSGYRFISFWRGFWQLLAWSVGTTLGLTLLGPPAATLMVQFYQWVPAVNFFVFGATARVMSVQVGMEARAKAGVVALIFIGAVFAVVAYLTSR
jgi:hypothetical protein